MASLLAGWARLALSTALVAGALLVGCPPALAGPANPNEAIRSFPKEQVIPVSIEMAAADLQDLLAKGMQEKEYAASITWGGRQFYHVALRTKGNSSLASVARSEKKRYSLKVDLNEYTPGQNLDGISTINLNNGFSDPSLLREFLSYEAFASLGVPVPAMTWVELKVNGKLWGLYLAVEQIGTPYLNRHFGNSQGDLYKPALQQGQGADLKWYGDSFDSYRGIVYKGKGSSHKALIAMLDALNNGGDLERHLDIDGILRYLAASTVLLNFDSYQGSFAHNYYLYEQDGRFTVLPWDLNMSFGGFGKGTSMERMIGVKIDEPTLGPVADRPLIAKLLAVPEYRERYHGYIQELITGYLEPVRFEARARAMMAFIDPYVKEDPTKFFPYEQFQRSLDAEVTAPVQPEAAGPGGGGQVRVGPGGGTGIGLLTLVRLRLPNVEQQLDGVLPSQGDGSGIGSVPAPGALFPGDAAPAGMGAKGQGGNRGQATAPDGPVRPGVFGGPDGRAGGAAGQLTATGMPPGQTIPLLMAVGLLLGAIAILWHHRPRLQK